MSHYLYTLSSQTINEWNLLSFDSKTLEVIDPVESTIESVPTADASHDKDYYHSDLYRVNLKRKVAGLQELTQNEFEDLIETQSIESISGSESESEDEQDRISQSMAKLSMVPEDEVESTVSHMNTKTPFLMFQSEEVSESNAIGVYKQNFSAGEIDDPRSELLKLSSPPIANGKSAVFMIGGGHFAGGIINHKPKDTRGNPSNHKESKQEQAVDVVKSKTFHRYTVRRKQGGSQSASDNARGKANSAGSSIRRYNEQALAKEIQDLLREWKEDIEQCHAVYIRANGPGNRKILVSEGGQLMPGDPRIRNFPFTTRRATKSELKRAWAELSYTKVLAKPKTIKKEAKVATKSPSPSMTAKEPTKEEVCSNELVSLLKKQKAPKLIAYLRQAKIDVNQFRLAPPNNYIHYPTLLHFAAANNLAHMVQILLVNLKANPTIANDSGKVPAEMCIASTRNTFQVARGILGEQQWDWKLAKVGPPMTKEEIAEKETAEQERLKREKQEAIKESLANKTEMELKQATIRSSGSLSGSNAKVDDLSGLSDTQKMRLMREQRARAAEERIRKMQGK